MSSLAAARADNFYYGTEYGPKHGSLNKFRGSHPLGDRAKRLHEGVLIIRFEMPYKSFCNKCNEVIAKGVRFNAEKRTVGHYFSTKILEFSMKCCFCDNIFKIQTDPKNCEYVPTAGLRRKVEQFSAKDAQTIEFRSIEERTEIEKDPMLKLETTFEDLSKARQSHDEIESLVDLQDSRHSSDTQYALNSTARKRFREWKKEEIAREIENKKPKNFALPLLNEHPTDMVEASSIEFCTHSSRMKRRIRESVLEATSIFHQRSKPVSRPSTPKSSIISRSTSRIVPSSVHRALSLIVRAPPEEHSAAPPPEKIKDRRARLHGDLERLRVCNRNATTARILGKLQSVDR